MIWYVLVAVIALAVGAFVGMLLRKKLAEAKIGSAEEEAKRILLDGEKQAETKKKEALIEAKEEILKRKNEADKEIKERRAEVSKTERRLEQKEENLDKKSEALEKKTAKKNQSK
jgi:ribonuclease Y